MVAIETSHIRLGLEFVTGEKTGARDGETKRWQHRMLAGEVSKVARRLQYNINATAYFLSPVKHRGFLPQACLEDQLSGRVSFCFTSHKCVS